MVREELYKTHSTTPAVTYGDLWTYSLTNCIKNCSLHGLCSYGRCHCDDGYYGLDCSNISCPGTTCGVYEDKRSKHKRSCVHCCFSGDDNTDAQTPRVLSQSSLCDNVDHHAQDVWSDAMIYIYRYFVSNIDVFVCRTLCDVYIRSIIS